MKARDNPFATARLHQVPFQFPPGQNWHSFLQRLADMHFCGALVGPEGSGKTTLLLELQTRLRPLDRQPLYLRLDAEHHRLPPDFWSNFFEPLTTRDVILLDGAEQLTRRDWNRFLHLSKAAGGLIITTHQPGRLPTLLDCHTSPVLFRSIVTQLLPNPELIRSLRPDDIFRQRNGNIRLALLDLYDHFANDAGPEKA